MFKVYGTTTCGFCKRATALLQERGYSYSYQSLDNEPELLQGLKEKYGWRTVPMIIFIEFTEEIGWSWGDKDGEETFIGGYTDLIEFLKNEEPSL